MRRSRPSVARDLAVAMEAALAAMTEQERVGTDRNRQLEIALEQARFEAARAGRQYDAVEPENRIVATDSSAGGMSGWEKWRGWRRNPDGAGDATQGMASPSRTGGVDRVGG